MHERRYCILCVTDCGPSDRAFFCKSQFFRLKQPNWAENLGGIWGIFGHFTHFSLVSPLSMFSINQPLLFYKKPSLHIHIFGPERIKDLAIVVRACVYCRPRDLFFNVLTHPRIIHKPVFVQL